MRGWFPFPFPRCPGCRASWRSCLHRNCLLLGEMEIEPWQLRVACASCAESWSVEQTQFYCACGRRFTAEEVDGALLEIIRATQLVHEELMRRQEELRRVRAQSDASFAVWLQTLATSLGAAAGFVVGRLTKLIIGSP